MSRRDDGNSRQTAFEQALQGKKIPILTLDNKWYQLMPQEARAEVSGLEKELNDLLKRQGRVNNELKDIKRLKKKLMGEIVSLMDEVDQNTEGVQKIEQNKQLVEQCNERLEGYQDELLDLPREIEKANYRLMLETMGRCYDLMQENAEEIEEIAQWVTDVRVELKKRLIRKQEMEQRNRMIYSYMHDVFGADVINLFDMRHGAGDQGLEEQE